MKVNKTRLFKKRVKLMFNFFFRVKSKLILLFLVLLAGCAVGSYFTVENLTAHYILGSLTALFFLLTLLCLLRIFNGNLTYQEVEEIIRHDRKIAYDGLFKNLAIRDNKADYVSTPVEVVSPELYPGRNTIVYRYVKKVNKIYYSQSSYNWLLFGKETLFHYRASINHIYGLVGYELAEEIKYSDIVNVKTIVGKTNNTETLTLSLGVSNGDNIDILLRNIPNQMSDQTRQLSEAEAGIINTVRKAIRENK